MKMYELYPHQQKSFYGKAKVFQTSYGYDILISYDTPVALIDNKGDLHRLWSGWNATTGRHLDSFSGQYQNKKTWDQMTVESLDNFKLTNDEKCFFEWLQ